MTVQRVLAAAAVLREFGLAEISAFCDEQPPNIIKILDSAAPAVKPCGEERWRVVDLEAVEFLDSTGLGVLVGGLKRVRAHEGSLRLVCTQERILKIFRITGLTKVFPIHSSVDEALSATD